MNIQRTILQCLNNVAPRMLTLGTLWSEVRMDCECSHSKFKAELDRLEMKGQVVVIDGEDRSKAKITQAGEARLAE